MSENLKAVARTYYDQGNNIVPVNTVKEALVKWAKWINQRQTQEEFESLPWQQAEGFGIICGLKLNNGMHIGTVDIDVKKTTQEVIDRGSELEKQLRTTQTEETVSGGKHYVYYSRKPIVKVKDAQKIHDFCGCEILGEKKLCIMAPSFNGKYRRLNDNPATGIESLNVLFTTALEKIGYTSRAHKNNTRLETKREVRPCILRLLENPHLSHLEKVAVVTEHKFSGMKQKEIEALFRKYKAWEGNDYDTEKTCYQINHIIEGKYKRFGQDTLKSMGLCSENCNLKENCMRTLTNFTNEDGVFNPVLFAKYLLGNFFFKTTRDNETLYVYDKKEKIYKPNGEVIVKEQIVTMLDEEARQKYLVDILFVIKGNTYFDRPKTPINKIVVENGVLNVLTGEIEENNTTDFLQIKIPITYDAKADCPNVKQFLNEVVGEKYAEFIQEYIGYCLCQNMLFHRVPVFYGEGMNGKTTLLDFLIRFLGQENVSSVTLQQLCQNRFSAFQLYGKLANICDDLPDDTIKHTGMFKMLTGNSFIQFEQKFKDSFTHNNTTKLIFATNKIPDAADMTPAWFRRWQPIPCNNHFVGEKRDVNMIEKITTEQELSGFLNFALAGLKKLLEKNDFCIKEDVAKQEKTMIWASNSAKAYIMEYLETTKDNTDQIPKDELYSDYIKFCKTNSLFVKDAATLTKSIKQMLPDAKESNIRRGKRFLHGWQYLKNVASVASVATKLILTSEKSKIHFKDSEEEDKEIVS